MLLTCILFADSNFRYKITTYQVLRLTIATKSLLMSYSVWGLEIMNIIAFLCCADNQACCAAKCVENQVCLLFGV